MDTAPFIAPVRSPYPAYKVQVCCMRNYYLYTSLSSDALNNSFSGNRVKNVMIGFAEPEKARLVMEDTF